VKTLTDKKMEHEAIEQELMDAFEYRSHDWDRAREILEQHTEIDVNKVCGKYGWTSLHYVAMEGDLLFTKYLVNDRGADVNITDEFERSAFMYAAGKNHLDVCQFLETEGADLNAQDREGKTAFIFAAKSGYLDLCRFLEGKGAIINTVDRIGRGAFSYACEDGRLRVCEFLADKTASLHETDKYGNSPIMFAAEGGYLDICIFLKERGADLSAKDILGDTALLRAARNKHGDVCRYLIKFGDTLNEKDRHGKTALEYVCEFGHYELLKLFSFLGATMPVFNKIEFDHRVGGKARKEIRNYISKHPLRQLLLGLVGAKMLTKMGKASSVKVLNVELIRNLFAMLGG
jgi:ankyrin repeat protein